MIGSIAEWGRRHGISREAARKRVRDHQIPLVDNGKIDFEAADRIWSASKNALQVQRGAESKPDPKSDPNLSHLANAQLEREQVRLEKERTELERLKIELNRLRGEMVRVDEVVSAVGEMISTAKEQLLNVGAELRDRVAASSDPIRCQKMIDERIYKALAHLAEFRLK